MARTANSVLRFGLELCALAALGWCGLRAGGLAGAALGLGAPLTAAVAWGLFVAPRSPRFAPLAGRLVVELLVFGAAVLALSATGRPALAAALGVAAAVNSLLVHLWRQDEQMCGG